MLVLRIRQAPSVGETWLFQRYIKFCFGAGIPVCRYCGTVSSLFSLSPVLATLLSAAIQQVSVEGIQKKTYKSQIIMSLLLIIVIITVICHHECY